MKRFKSPFFLLLILCSIQLSAKKIGIDISYAQFMNAEDEGYLEIYFALAGNSIDFAKIKGNKYQGGVEITAAIKQDSTFISADKFLLQSPELNDTLDFAEVYINQIRFPLEKGNYILVLDIKDINDPAESYHFEQEFTLELGGSDPTTSDLLFLHSYSPAKEGSVFAKSGYDLVPMVSSGSYYFNEAVPTLSFYVELYNTKDVLGENEPYIVKYYLQNTSTGEVLNKYASFAKKTSSTVEPVLASFNIEHLKTGNYNLVIEALNRDGESIISKKAFFYRKNNGPSVDFQDMANTDITGTFADLIGGIDSLYLFTKYLFPISTDAERNYQKSLLTERDLKKMKQYFYVFWSQRNDYDPQTEWENYRKRIREVNYLYDSGLRPGYMTDRGRVSLVYGKPDIVEQRKFESGTYPYELWRYDKLQSRYLDIVEQTNKIFVFAEFSLSSNEYRLIHSTALGELQDRRWQYTLSNRKSGSSDLDDNTSQYNDGWGSKINNNSIIIPNENNR